MPAIKKKWMKASHDEGSNVDVDKDDKEDQRKLDQSKDLVTMDLSIDLVKMDQSKDLEVPPVDKSPKKPQGPSMLRKLDGEVLVEKRKRFVPMAELKLSEWLSNNFEERSDVSIKLTLMYKHYTELCQAACSDILGVTEFNRMVKEKFGKTFGLQENSAYKTVLKERKITDKKSGPTGGIRWKDIIHEAINHLGNPSKGIRFSTLEKYIASKYPALQLDRKPNILKNSLNLGHRCGYYDLVKGVGKAGSYRLPGEEIASPKPKESNKKEGKADGEEKSSDENDKDEAQAQNEEEKEADVKKKIVVKKLQPFKLSQVSFSSPKRLEDIFPLAFTYQSAPKIASSLKIRRYLLEQYGETVTDHRLKQAFESGVNKGYWEHYSGSGISGSLHLQMDDFDPSSNQLEDMICASIIACHEPKSASASSVKKYVTRYHPEFGVDQHPERYHKALRRAVDRNLLTQLSGIGATGTYQMLIPFTPSPTVLAGDDDSDLEEEYEAEEKPVYVSRGTKSRGRPTVKTMEVVRSPQKKARTGSSNKKVQGRTQSVSLSRGKQKSGSQQKSSSKSPRMKNGRKRALSPLTDEEEEEEEEEEVEATPSKSRSRGGSKGRSQRVTSKSKTPVSSSKKKQSKSPNKKTPMKRSNPSKKTVPLSDEDEDEVDDATEYTPRKSMSRGGGREEMKSSGKSSGKKSSRRRR